MDPLPDHSARASQGVRVGIFWVAGILVLSASCVQALAQSANSASCRKVLGEAQLSIATQVVLLRRYEHEASDRLKGLDSRPFDYLIGEARKATAVIADEAAFKREAELSCPGPTAPMRERCAEGAKLLVAALEMQIAKPPGSHDKAQYAAAMAACEKHIGLKPLRTIFRGTD